MCIIMLLILQPFCITYGKDLLLQGRRKQGGREGSSPLKSALGGLSPQTPLEGTEHGTIAMHPCMYPNSLQPPPPPIFT